MSPALARVQDAVWRSAQPRAAHPFSPYTHTNRMKRSLTKVLLLPLRFIYKYNALGWACGPRPGDDASLFDVIPTGAAAGRREAVVQRPAVTWLGGNVDWQWPLFR